MAQSITTTLAAANPPLGSVNKVQVTLVSASDGSCAGIIKNKAGSANYVFAGQVERIVTDPDATDAPSDNWDLTLKDEHGIDIAAGLLANRDTATTESVQPAVTLVDGQVVPPESAIPVTKFVVNGTLAVGATNMGSGKKAQLTIYLRV